MSVVRRSDVNAFAMPGGHVYVYQGLIDNAETPDELAGVVAHELGHVAHRDGTRTVLQAAGLSFLFGMLLGDFVGGGAVVIAAKTVLRVVLFARRRVGGGCATASNLMGKVGGDPRALGTILTRMVSGKRAIGVKILLDHPETKERIAAIDAMAETGATSPLLEPAEWSALKQICSERKASNDPTAPAPRPEMAIRRIADQPTSRLAIWARRIALFSLAATLLAIVIVRSGMLRDRARARDLCRLRCRSPSSPSCSPSPPAR